MKLGKKRGQEHEGDMPITHVKRSLLIPSLLFFLAAWALVYWILIRFTNSTVPVPDSFGNALSFIGLWWLARKYVEQWLLWMSSQPSMSTKVCLSPPPSTPSMSPSPWLGT